MKAGRWPSQARWASGIWLGGTMDGSENRQLARDSLFVMADLRLDGVDGEHRIKMRNLSSGGMMGEGAVRVSRGASVQVNVRNIGWVEGTVAWVQDNRFGVAFTEEIDPRDARSPLGEGTAASTHPRPVVFDPAPGGAIRKI
jgi:hypothetical protein